MLFLLSLGQLLAENVGKVGDLFEIVMFHKSIGVST